MLEKFHAPGAFWIAIIAFTMKWLPELFPGAPWLSYALLCLLALSKAVEVIVTSPVQATSRELFARHRSNMSRFLF